MSKEYLDAFKIVYNNFDYLISDVCIENDDVNICLKTIKEQLPTIKQALLRLESIDNTEPNEALECLELMGGAYLCKHMWGDETVAEGFKEEINTIKQALLKAQKEHKALEILKKIIDFDLVEIGRRKVCIYSDNDDNDVVKMISEEEFNALEEVL